LKQFILPSPPYREGSQEFIRLSGKDYHYLVRVRRLAEGSAFTALLPDGKKVRVLVRSVDNGVLVGECLPGEKVPGAFLPPIVLFQALPKGAKMDLIIRQAAEGGVSEIVPFESGRSVRRLEGRGNEGRETGRLERWRRIVREARQQSGSGIATEVGAPRSFGEMAAYWGELRESRERPVGLLLHTNEGSPLANGGFHGYLEGGPDLVAMAVGPEGGFAPEEAARLVEAGFKAVSLGDTVLRTETAALYAAAAIRVILMESDLWIHKQRM
jgi:16S rRNA (uracil1498-N3)-methyltransferase